MSPELAHLLGMMVGVCLGVPIPAILDRLFRDDWGA